jgi:uncharacterized protein YcbX
MPEAIATVEKLSLYPVKSMAGTPVTEAHIGLDGVLGDRQYSFVRADQAAKSTFPWMTARESSRMLLYKPEFMQPPSPGQPEPPLKIRTPDGAIFDPSDSHLTEELTGKTGHALFLLRSGRGIFDCQHVSIFSLATLRALAGEAGVSIDPRQFRANVYIEPASGQAFDEEAWTGHLLQIGSEALIGVTQRDSRCMMVNLDPDTGDQNPRVLKAIAQHHQGQAGIYANIVRPGTVHVGDAIRVVAMH